MKKSKLRQLIREEIKESYSMNAFDLRSILELGAEATIAEGEEHLIQLSDAFEEYTSTVDDDWGYYIYLAEPLNMAIELLQDGYSKDASFQLKKFNMVCVKALADLDKSVNEAESIVKKLNKELGYDSNAGTFAEDTFDKDDAEFHGVKPGKYIKFYIEDVENSSILKIKRLAKANGLKFVHDAEDMLLFRESVNEAEFKHINPSENKIKLAIKDVEKKFRLKANRDNPPQYAQLSLNKIMLSKVLGREELGKEHQGAWEKLKQEYNLRDAVNEGFTKDDWDVKWKLPKDNLFNASKSIDAVNNRSNAIQDLLKLNPKALQAFNNDDEHPAMKMSYNELMRWYYPIMKESVSEGPGQKHYTKDGKEWTGPTHKMPNGPLMTGDPHNDDSEELFHKADLKEVADPSALELVGALSVILGGSFGIKLGMDLLNKIVDKALAAAKYTATEILKIVKDNTAALKAAAQEGKRAFVKKLISLIGITSPSKDDIPFTIKRNEGTCGYDTDARTGKKFKTPGGL